MIRPKSVPTKVTLKPNTDEVCNAVGIAYDKPRGARDWKTFWQQETGEKWPSQCSMCPKVK